jgi:hypothetical protein
MDAVTLSMAQLYSARKLQAGVEHWDDFTKYPNGPAPVASPTGQAYRAYGADNDPARLPFIGAGGLTQDPNQYKGSYFQSQWERTPVFASTTFTFSPWTTGGGTACLALCAVDFADYVIANGPGKLPVFPVHMLFNPEGWGVSTNPVAGSPAVTSRGGGLYVGGNLVSDGVARHTASICLDQVNSTLYVLPPDGSVHKIVHPDFALPGTHGFVEPFKDAVAGRTTPTFTDWTVDSRRRDYLPFFRALAAQPQPRISFANYGTDQTIASINAVGGTSPFYSTIPMATTASVSKPASGQCIFRASANISITTDVIVEFVILDETNTVLLTGVAGQSVAESGQVTVELNYTFPGSDLVGAKRTFKLAVRRRTNTGAAALRLGTVSGAAYRASLTVIPI